MRGATPDGVLGGSPLAAVTAADRAPEGAPVVPLRPRLSRQAPVPPEPVEPARPIATHLRQLIAYLVTARVAISYFSLAVQKRFRSEESIARIATEKHRKNARRIHDATARLQGLFIKVGQLISIMANFLPEAFRRELEGLQDRVPPRPYRDIEARLKEEFGGRMPGEVFAGFDERPVASASIGQVHVATLPSGEKVAVKVQYPDIEQIVKTDLLSLRRIFGLLSWWMPDYGFRTIYGEIREMVLTELDYGHEARSMSQIAANLKDRPNVKVPRVMSEFSTARVLTTEWIDGVKAADLDQLERAGISPSRAARACVEAYCQQIFVDGLYHADPHPGNLIIGPPAAAGGDPTVVFIDFGATGRVSEEMRRGLISFLQGAMTRDTVRLVSAMKDMGFISRRADPEVFDRVVEYFHDKFRSKLRVEGWSLKDIKFAPEESIASLLDLRELNVSLADLRDAFHVPKEWILLERALLLLLGVCTTLDPDMNPTALIQPYVERFLLGEKKDWSEAMVEASREMALAALALPGELNRFIGRAMRGELEVRFRNFEQSALLVYSVGQQILWGMLGATATTLAVVLDGRGQTGAARGAGAAATFFGLLLIWSLLVGRGRMRRR